MSGVTYRGTINLTSIYSDGLTIANGITLSNAAGTGVGTINLTYSGAELAIVGNTTLNNVVINGGAYSGNTSLVSQDHGVATTLTLGSITTINANGLLSLQNGQTNGLNDTIVNQGTMNASGSHGAFFSR